MANEPDIKRDPMQQFQDQLKERVRNDIRDLLPDEAIQAMVKKAIEEEFFTDRVSKDQYGRITDRNPSWFVEEVVKVATPLLKSAVDDAVESNGQMIRDTVNKYLEVNQLTVAVMTKLDTMLGTSIREMQQTLQKITGQY